VPLAVEDQQVRADSGCRPVKGRHEDISGVFTRKVEAMSAVSREVATCWEKIEPLLSIRNERDYDLAVERLNALLDEIGTDQAHPMYGILDTLGTLVHSYEEEHYSMPRVTGAEMLRFLMSEHDLKQSDLPEVGSQGVVSEILSGKRELNVRQIRALGRRFGVPPAAFID
jgi:HTH-type transcriptional regulator/antitoxin HigA